MSRDGIAKYMIRKKAWNKTVEIRNAFSFLLDFLMEIMNRNREAMNNARIHGLNEIAASEENPPNSELMSVDDDEMSWPEADR